MAGYARPIEPQYSNLCTNVHQAPAPVATSEIAERFVLGGDSRPARRGIGVLTFSTARESGESEARDGAPRCESGSRGNEVTLPLAIGSRVPEPSLPRESGSCAYPRSGGWAP